MTAAPVGFQCPDCVASAQSVNQRPGSRSGGGALAAATRGRPVVTWTIVGICVVVYLAEFLRGVDNVSANFGMYPLAIGIGGEWYRLVTSVFLHGSLLHIGFNMYVLVALGPTLERILGHGRYLVLFLLCGLGGSVFSYWWSNPTTVSVGASGAIFGLMGALLVAGRRLRYDVTTVLVLVGINLAIGFLFGGIDWRAHIGGLVTGAALAAVMVLPDGRSRRVMEWAGVAGVVVVLAAIVLFRTVAINALVG